VARVAYFHNLFLPEFFANISSRGWRAKRAGDKPPSTYKSLCLGSLTDHREDEMGRACLFFALLEPKLCISYHKLHPHQIYSRLNDHII